MGWKKLISAGFFLALPIAGALEAAALPGIRDPQRIQQHQGEPGAILPDLDSPGILPLPPPDTDPSETDLPTGEPFVPPDSGDLEAPAIETIELDETVAKRALDAFVVVKEKYKDADIESYTTLEEFVSATDEGKAFEKDIKGFGFPSVGDWNTAITTVSIAYSAVAENQETEIRNQIEDLKNDPELTEDARAKITESLLSMLPSENNKKIIRTLMDLPEYQAKLKILTEDTD
jgi:predicted transport protein